MIIISISNLIEDNVKNLMSVRAANFQTRQYLLSLNVKFKLNYQLSTPELT